MRFVPSTLPLARSLFAACALGLMALPAVAQTPDLEPSPKPLGTPLATRQS